MPFKFSVWSSRAGDKLDISDRVIIWRAGLIRGRVAATYNHSPTSSTDTAEQQGVSNDDIHQTPSPAHLTSLILRLFACFWTKNFCLNLLLGPLNAREELFLVVGWYFESSIT